LPNGLDGTLQRLLLSDAVDESATYHDTIGKACHLSRLVWCCDAEAYYYRQRRQTSQLGQRLFEHELTVSPSARHPFY
jgi:hypothetical protein